MSDVRTHPDLFTRDEAAAYLHLENAATIDWCRAQGFLSHYMAGKQMMFWREDLDDCAKKIVGQAPEGRVRRKPLALAE